MILAAAVHYAAILYEIVNALRPSQQQWFKLSNAFRSRLAKDKLIFSRKLQQTSYTNIIKDVIITKRRFIAAKPYKLFISFFRIKSSSRWHSSQGKNCFQEEHLVKGDKSVFKERCNLHSSLTCHWKIRSGLGTYPTQAFTSLVQDCCLNRQRETRPRFFEWFDIYIALHFILFLVWANFNNKIDKASTGVSL